MRSSPLQLAGCRTRRSNDNAVALCRTRRCLFCYRPLPSRHGQVRSARAVTLLFAAVALLLGWNPLSLTGSCGKVSGIPRPHSLRDSRVPDPVVACPRALSHSAATCVQVSNPWQRYPTRRCAGQKGQARLESSLRPLRRNLFGRRSRPSGVRPQTVPLFFFMGQWRSDTAGSGIHNGFLF